MNSFGKSLRAFGRKEIWSWPLFWIALPLYSMLSLAFDVFLAQSWRIEWLWIAIISLGAVTLLAIGIKFLIIDRFFQVRNAWLINLLTAALLGAIKNVLVGELSILFGLVDSADWLFRSYGGAGLGIGILLFYIYILGSRIDHVATMNQLIIARDRLITHRSQAGSLLNHERASLLQQTQSALLPRLEQIQAALLASAERSTTIDALRNLIQKEVRPLSEALNTSADKLTFSKPPTPARIARPRMLQATFLLKPLIRPGSMFLLFMAGNWFLSFIILGTEAAIWSLAYSLGSWLLIVVVKAIIPQTLRLKRRSGIFLLLLIGFTAANPTYWPLKEFSHNLEQDLLLLLVVLNVMACVFGFAYSRSYELDRIEAVNQMTRDNDSLAREMALFEQQMWIARRNWNFVVHGTVQAALTAAITRLSSNQELEQYQIDLVMQDLNRAKEALMQTPDLDIDLASAQAALTSTWQGICNVQWQVTQRASRALLRDVNARMCVNEICKEAVSNAVRHGEAKNVWIEIDRSTDELLIIKCGNDGRYLTAKELAGVGSQMYDGLTLDWSLQNAKAMGRVMLEATLPLSVISVGRL